MTKQLPESIYREKYLFNLTLTEDFIISWIGKHGRTHFSITGLSEIQTFYRDICVSQSDYQISETMIPKEMQFSQDSHSARKKKYQPEGDLCP